MKQLIVTFLFFSFFILCSQEHIPNDLTKTNLKSISKKSSFFRERNNLDSAIYYAKRLLKKSESVNDTIYITKAYKKLALYHKLDNKPVEAVRFYNYLSELSLYMKDTLTAVDAIRHITSIQKKIGDLSSSESKAIEGLNLVESLPYSSRKKHQLGLLNHLGITTKELKNYKDSKRWYLKALELVEDSINIIKINNNISVVDLKQGNYKEGLDRLLRLNETFALSSFPIMEAKVLDNIALAKSKLKDPTAEKELLLALECRKDLQDLSGQFASHIHLTEYYKNKNLNNKAITHANQAYRIAAKMQSKTSELEALSYLMDLESNPESVASKFKKLIDSIYSAREQARGEFAKIKYETDKTRAQNLILKTEVTEKDLKLTEETSKRNIFILLSALLLISVGFILFNWQQRIKFARIKERHHTNKRLSKKLHDEVGNDLYYLILQLQKISGFDTDHENLKTLKGFDTVYHKIRDFSRDNKIETGEEYGDELLSLLDSYGDDETKVITSELEPDFWSEIAPVKKEELYWVLKELLTNMKRHSQANIVAITFAKEKRKIKVNYIDDGIGMNFSKSTSKNGLANVETRMKDIGGTITFDSKPKEGFKATIVFSP